MRFDPMTGEPVQEVTQPQPAPQPGPEVRYDPMTGQPVPPTEAVYTPKKRKKWPIVLAAAAVILALAGTAAAAVMPRIIYGKNYAVIQAFENTFVPNLLMENMNFADVLDGGAATLDLSADMEGQKLTFSLAADADAKEVSFAGDAAIEGMNVEFGLKVDDSALFLSVPQFMDRTFTYAYNGKNNGYLAETLKDVGLDLDDFDEVLRSLFSDNSRKLMDGDKALDENFRRLINDMDFEKSEKRTVKVDGKERNCQGYTLDIDDKLIDNLCDVLENIMEDALKDYDTALYEDLDISDAFDELRDMAEEIDDMKIKLTVYIYKKQIAAILVKSGDSKMILELNGGYTPWENASLKVDKEEVLKLSGSVKKNVETVELEIGGETIAEYEYDSKSGDLDITVAKGVAKISGSVLKTKNSVTYELSKVRGIGVSLDMKIRMEIKKGADIANISTKNVFDVGNATKEEWYGLGDDLSEEWLDYLKDMLGGYGDLIGGGDDDDYDYYDDDDFYW